LNIEIGFINYNKSPWNFLYIHFYLGRTCSYPLSYSQFRRHSLFFSMVSQLVDCFEIYICRWWTEPTRWTGMWSIYKEGRWVHRVDRPVDRRMKKVGWVHRVDSFVIYIRTWEV